MLPARMKKIQEKIMAPEWSQHYSLTFHMLKGIFIVVLVTCKNEENPSKVSLLQLLNFKPIQDFMVFLVTCKNEEDPIKSKETRVVARFSLL